MLKNLSKAAMFGLFRALKKQLGELFLARRQSEAPEGTNGSFKTNRAAMFGLDARIALAIFGSLSVITFASIHKAATSANASLYMQELTNVKQAFNNFRQDTGIRLPKNSNTYYYNVRYLLNLAVDNNIPYTKKYNGPYLNYDDLTDTSFKSKGLNETFRIVSRSYATSWTSQAIDGSEACSETDCAAFIEIESVNPQFAEKIKSEMDNNSTNNDTGPVRLIANGSNYNVYYYLDKE